jgi:predicted dehydrogenase
LVEPVRFGLLGYGFGGRYFHAPLIASASACTLVAVVTTSSDRRALVASEHPGVEVCGSLDELVATGVEAVAISTPARTHTELTDAALRRGLAVVCDKPFSLDASSALRTVKLAEELGLVLSPYQNRRWDSDFLTMQLLATSGRLGGIARFESRFERYAPGRGPGMAGGGTLLDFGSHLVDQALVLLGPVETVYAEWRLRESGLDDDVFIALTHGAGVHSMLWGSWSQSAPGLRFRLTGSDAAYVVKGPMDGQEALLVSGATPSTLGERWGHEMEDRWGQLRRGDHSETIPSLPGAWDTYYPAFASAVRGLSGPPVAARDAVETARVLDAARQSAITREVVNVT